MTISLQVRKTIFHFLRTSGKGKDAEEEEEEPLALDAVTAPAIAVACFISLHSHTFSPAEIICTDRRDHMCDSPRSYVQYAEIMCIIRRDHTHNPQRS